MSCGYAIGIFISFELDPREWWVLGRIMTLIFVVAVSTEFISQYQSTCSLIDKSKHENLRRN